MLPTDRISAKEKFNRIGVGYLMLVSDLNENMWAVARVLEVQEHTIQVSLVTIIHSEDSDAATWHPGKEVSVSDTHTYFFCTVELAQMRAENWYGTGHVPPILVDHDAPISAFYMARFRQNHTDVAARSAAIVAGAYAA